MALQHTSLTKLLQLAAAAAAIYTQAAAQKSHVRGFLLHNSNSQTEYVSIYWVQPAAGAAGAAALSNRIAYIGMQSGETIIWEVPYGLVMDATNETIQAFSSTVNKVNCAVLGDKDY